MLSCKRGKGVEIYILLYMAERGDESGENSVLNSKIIRSIQGSGEYRLLLNRLPYKAAGNNQ